MTYKLYFFKSAKKEWDKLSPEIREQFKKKLAKCLQEPHIQNNKLSGMTNCYKIKLRNIGYRLVYQVKDNELIVAVVSVGMRDKNLVYRLAELRLNDQAQ